MKALNLISETVVSVNLVSSVVLSPSVSLSKHDFCKVSPITVGAWHFLFLRLLGFPNIPLLG